MSRNILFALADRCPNFIIAALVLWCLVTVCSGIAGATTVLGFIDNREHRIIFAADSKRRRYQEVFTANGEQMVLAPSTPECKLRAFPNCVVGFAGMPDMLGVADMHELAEAACAQPGDFRRHVDWFEAQAVVAAQNVVALLKAYGPDIYEKRIATGGAIIMAIFGGIQDGHLMLIAYGINVNRGGGLDPWEATKTDSDRLRLVVLGEREEMFDYAEKHTDWDANGDVTRTVSKFVEMEASAHPDIVGPPIATVELTHPLLGTDPNAIAVNWIDRGLCR